MNDPKPQSAEEKALAKSNAPTSAGHHPAQPATPVSPATHPNQPASIDNVEPRLPAKATVAPVTALTTAPVTNPAVTPTSGTAPAPTKPGGPAVRPVSPLVAEAQSLREELQKFVDDNGEFDKLRDRHAALLAECQDTLSRSDFAAATGILDVCAGLLNRVAPRP